MNLVSNIEQVLLSHFSNNIIHITIGEDFCRKQGYYFGFLKASESIRSSFTGNIISSWHPYTQNLEAKYNLPHQTP